MKSIKSLVATIALAATLSLGMPLIASAAPPAAATSVAAIGVAAKTASTYVSVSNLKTKQTSASNIKTTGTVTFKTKKSSTYRYVSVSMNPTGSSSSTGKTQKKTVRVKWNSSKNAYVGSFSFNTKAPGKITATEKVGSKTYSKSVTSKKASTSLSGLHTKTATVTPGSTIKDTVRVKTSAHNRKVVVQVKSGSTWKSYKTYTTKKSGSAQDVRLSLEAPAAGKSTTYRVYVQSTAKASASKKYSRTLVGKEPVVVTPPAPKPDPTPTPTPSPTPTPKPDPTPTPSPTPPSTAVVPSLAGKSESQVRSTLSTLGLTAKISTTPNGKNFGTALSQSPAAGTTVQLGTTVNVTVSGGCGLDDTGTHIPCETTKTVSHALDMWTVNTDCGVTRTCSRQATPTENSWFGSYETDDPMDRAGLMEAAKPSSTIYPLAVPKFFDQLNAYRAKVGSPAVKPFPSMANSKINGVVAPGQGQFPQEWSVQMAKAGKISHSGPRGHEGDKFAEWANAAHPDARGYQWGCMENAGTISYSTSSREIIDAWSNSPGHNAGLKASGHQFAAVGAVMTADGQTYYTYSGCVLLKPDGTHVSDFIPAK